MSDNEKKSFKHHPAYQPILLGLMTLVAAAALANADLITRPEIEQRRAEDLRNSLGQVLPETIHDNNVLDNTVTVSGTTAYRATKADVLTGIAYGMSGQGYGGEISVLMGLSPDGSLLGVRVLSHSETPGLGDKIEAKKSSWIKAFDGRSASNTTDAEWAVKKDGGVFDQFSGATITPRAVVATVKKGLAFFAAHKDELLKGQGQ